MRILGGNDEYRRAMCAQALERDSIPDDLWEELKILAGVSFGEVFTLAQEKNLYKAVDLKVRQLEDQAERDYHAMNLNPLHLDFRLVKDKIQLPVFSAIYFAVTDKRHVCYIGAAQNLRARWSSHNILPDLEKVVCQQKDSKTRIAFLPVDGRIRRRIFEREAIKRYQPQFNSQHTLRATSLRLP